MAETFPLYKLSVMMGDAGSKTLFVGTRFGAEQALAQLMGVYGPFIASRAVVKMVWS